MKINLHCKIALTLLLAVVAFSPDCAVAQESDVLHHEYPPVVEPSESSSGHTFHASEEERSAKPVMNTYVAKDSLLMKTSNDGKHAKTKLSSNNQKEPQEGLHSGEKNQDEKNQKDSILSFNFFYYIFQKFKMSDIVDK